jgi:galactokinase
MKKKEQEIFKSFQEQFGKSPEVLVRAPGRINLIGEHTDYNEGFVLPAAIDKEIVFAVGFAPDQVSKFHAFDLDESHTFESDHIEITSENSWANYLLGVIAQFKKKGLTVPSLQISYGGDVPLGAGLSSSAAVECGIAFAINELINSKCSKEELAFIAQKAEHEFAGVQCGIMDQFASVMGKKEHVLRLDCKTMAYKFFPFPMEEYQIVLCDTGVKHSLASSEYNTRRKECESGVALLAKYYPETKSLRDVTIEILDNHKHEIDPVVFKRCKYVVEENNRVLAGCEDLAAGNLASFGEKMYCSHQGLSVNYEVSCKELDFLVEQTIDKPFVLGARMMGGGFGGCTINLVKVTEIGKFEEAMKAAYQKQFNIQLLTYKVTIENGTDLINF